MKFLLINADKIFNLKWLLVSLIYVGKGENVKLGFIGMLLTFCLILPAIVLGGSKGFFNAPSLIICTLVPISLSIASTGMSDLAHALRTLRCLLVPQRDTDLTVRNTQVLRHMILYTYAAGIIGMMIGWIQMLR